jgi:hypothetical protein
LGEGFPIRITAILAAGFALLSGESRAEDSACTLQAWADPAGMEWLKGVNASELFAEHVSSNKFNFIGPADNVPWTHACGEVWLSACSGKPNSDKWIKLHSGSTCTASATATATASAVSTETQTEFHGESTAPTEPARATCDPATSEPAEPSITAQMREAAAEFPELQDNFHRQNHFVDSVQGVKQGVADTRGGSEVNDEVAGWINDGDYPIKILQHYEQTSGGPWIFSSRNSAAVVAQEGFSRRITTLYSIWRTPSEGWAHSDAEGIALVQKRAADKEREKQLELAETLSKVEAKLKPDVTDLDSVQKTETFRQLALTRAANLAGLSCQLGSMAAIDADRQRRQVSLASDPIHSYGDGGGRAPAGGTSGLTSTSTETNIQIGPGGIKISTVTFTNTKMETSTSTSTFPSTELEQTLAPFGPVDPPKLDSPEIGDANSGLFARTHAKLQQKEKNGTFRGTIVEEDPVQLMP